MQSKDSELCKSAVFPPHLISTVEIEKQTVFLKQPETAPEERHVYRSIQSNITKLRRSGMSDPERTGANGERSYKNEHAARWR